MVETQTAETLQLAHDNAAARGLLQAAKWAAQQLLALPLEQSIKAVKSDVQVVYLHTYQAAKSHFDMKEFAMCSAVFEKNSNAHQYPLAKCPVSSFLYFYAKFLALERRFDDAGSDAETSVKQRRNELAQLLQKLKQESSTDGYLLYLQGVLSTKLGLQQEACQLFTQAINAAPENWAAWLELAKCFTHFNQVARHNLQLPDGIMKEFYLAHIDVEFHQHTLPNTDAYARIHKLLTIFPASTYLLSQRGLLMYNQRHYRDAEQVFRMLHQLMPDSVEYMDVYSNILFVCDNHGDLSALAQSCLKVEKYRPETCCVIGNYYGMKNMHEKAILYFKRAIALNRSYLSAWTLLGHEYLEVNNAHAALEAYRRAIDISHRDYRAWFGLGQTYEMLKMEYYAVHYFQKAAELRPSDGRMWTALASVYETLEKNREAIKCLRRALCDYETMLDIGVEFSMQNDKQVQEDDEEDEITYQDGLSLLQLAKLLETTGQQAQARRAYQVFIAKCDHEEHSSASVAVAYKFLGHYAKNNQDWREADECAKAMIAIGGAEKEDGKVLLGEIRLKQRTSGN